MEHPPIYAPGWFASYGYSDPDEDTEGTAGVREPRRPVEPPNRSRAYVALPHVHDAQPDYLEVIA